MFERYITDALTTHFGHIVESVDADKMQLSAWKGELELNDVSLKTNALDNILKQECPVEIAFGYIGTFQVKIPWSLLSAQLLSWQKDATSESRLLESSACSIVLSDVNILITPRRRTSGEATTTPKDDHQTGDEAGADPDLELRRRIDKEREVQSLLDADLLKRVTESSVSSARLTWLQNWISSLLSTLSVTIRNIHIRYEDPGTSMGFQWRMSHELEVGNVRQQRYRPAFAVGITLKEFSVQSVAGSSATKTMVGLITSRVEEKNEEESPMANVEDDATTISSKVSVSTAERSAECAEKDAPDEQVTPPQLPFIKRHKLAAADDLAIYWNSDSSLVCESVTQQVQDASDNLPKQELHQLYRDSFSIFNESDNHHSYLLEPISPSVHLTLVSPASQSRNEENKTEQRASPKSLLRVSATPEQQECPPSSIQIDLPPCKFSFARNTLEDGVYLRKSHSVWTDATKTLLSEEALRRLAGLRPTQSPFEDPRSWWLYAFEATKTLMRVEQHRQDTSVSRKTIRGVSSDDLNRPPPLMRRKGWFGLVQAVSRRRKYVRLYEEFIKAVETHDVSTEDNVNAELLKMEDDLLPDEIVSFRMRVYESLRSKSEKRLEEGTIDGTEFDTTIIQDASHLERGDDQEILSVRHRRWMMNEMKLALDRERANKEIEAAEKDQMLSMDGSVSNKANPVVWSSSLVCRELSIQINDQSSNHVHSERVKSLTPVVRMSSAIVQDHSWNKDGSWVSSWSIASFEVKDLVSSRGQGSSPTYFSTLLGKKSCTKAVDTDEFIIINGIRYHRNISVTVSKRLHWPRDRQRFRYETSDRGSTTTTLIRVLPMEIVYSTLPVEAVTRVFATVRTPEIVDDYHRVLAAANSWREEQKRKLIDALAHKNKKIIVDIDVGAPELLIPENVFRHDSPMLSIDLGRIQAFNDDEALNGDGRDMFDDQWSIKISNIQVQSTSVSSYFSVTKSNSCIFNSVGIQSPQQLVEAFSIDFAVSTKIRSEDSSTPGAASRIHVSATLPRLAFNLTSSAVRLVSRLQERWRRRKKETEIFQLQTHGIVNGGAHNRPSSMGKAFGGEISGTKSAAGEATVEQVKSSRAFMFAFSAPLITIKLENDTPAKASIGSTPLFDLAIGGVSGRLSQKNHRNGDSSTCFNASLQSLGVIDLFQSAGNDFALLMSSVPQVLLIDDIMDGHSYSWNAVRMDHDPEDAASRRKALVTIEYLHEVTSLLEKNGQRVLNSKPTQVSIWFHELYVEWNPETLAAIQQAIAIPAEPFGNTKPQKPKQPTQEDSWDSADEFFDAMEDLDEMVSQSDGSRSLSEISSASDHLGRLETSSSPPRTLVGGGFIGDRIISPGRLSFASGPGSPFASGLSYFDTGPLASLSNLENKEEKPKANAMKIVFELAKLRVSFNKETRHRKLMIAQMDRTFVSYSTKVTGGSNTSMRIGNLVFVDPIHEEKGTLYGHILGLKNDASDGTDNSASSLLEMDIVLNPKTRQFSSLLSGCVSDPVTIDRHEGAMIGSDCWVTATFSPMRFVLIQQLWLEIIDYFFQGVIGSEVLGGGKSETPGHPEQGIPQRSFVQNSAFLPGSDAFGISFTRFHISLDSPVILLPVTYSSPEFVRLDLSKIVVANEFRGSPVSDEAADISSGLADRMQWFNNCNVAFEALRIFSWSGLELGKEPTSGCVHLRWPTGPFSHLILPKWNVGCTFDELDVSLRRSDYALLQNIISLNIGEPSRYMDEWNALQNLSAGALHEYMRNIIVHYGYDKKDVAPSTYDMTFCVPSLKFSLMDGQKTSSPPVATARCFDLKFKMSKGADLLVRQNLSCDIDLVTPGNATSEVEKLLSMSKYDHDLGKLKTSIDEDEEKPGLTYSSVTTPSQGNVRSIEITDPCIYMIIPKWRKFASFFQSMPSPILLNDIDIGASIQVGDRWYRIGDGASSPLVQGSSSSKKKNVERFSWINIGSSTNINLGPTRNSFRMSALESSNTSTHQLRVLLTWPRIVLSSKSTEGLATRVILRLNHLDYLQTNSEGSCSLKKSLFLHDVEVYTSSEHQVAELSRSQQADSSLIRPWSVALETATCNGESMGDCKTHEYRLSADVLRARAAYSDMAIALDVILSVLYSAKEETKIGKELSIEPVFTAASYDSVDSQSVKNGENEVEDDVYCKTPSLVTYDLQCDGFQLQVADDSGRHFASSQDLIIFSLGGILLSQRDYGSGVTEIKLWLRSLELVDCLQPLKSRFRLAASSHAILKETDAHSFGLERKMGWDEFASLSRGFFYEASLDFVTRVEDAFNECSTHFWCNEGSQNPGLIEIDSKICGNHQEYDIRIGSLVVQWNPSTVIAIQRFLGRLRKESNLIADQLNDIIRKSADDQPDRSAELADKNKQSVSVVAAKISVDNLKVCLNKEHQYRRLMEVTLSECNAQLDVSDDGLFIKVGIYDLLAVDTDDYVFSPSGSTKIPVDVRRVLSVVRAVNQDTGNFFLQILYTQFATKGTASNLRADIPEWAKSHASSPDDIDDVLSVTMAATRFTYVKERTEEILDYLSNGLPGKGMGATSRAAKGFISSRIQTKSFLQIQVVSPQVYVPQHEMEKQGLVFKLGDVTVRSWFEENTPNKVEGDDPEWWRVLSLKITGFLSGITRAGPDFPTLSSASDPVDLDVTLRKPTVGGRPTSIRGKLSSLGTRLNYSDYALMRAVMRDNIGRPVDKERWDNVEKAYWMESSDAMVDNEAAVAVRLETGLQNVHYSSNARFVRYGTGGKMGRAKTVDLPGTNTAVDSDSGVQKTLDLQFDLAGFSLKLRRDDLVAGISPDDELASAFHYDVMLLRVQAVEILATSNSNGDSSLNLSLFRLGLFDLGDKGRLTRERYFYSLPDQELVRLGIKRNILRRPCPFHVLVEGYDASSDGIDVASPSAAGPQFVTSIDTCPASSTTGFGSLSDSGLPPDSKVTVARVVVNHLSVNALVRPFQEILDFLTVQWEADTNSQPDFLKRAKNTNGDSSTEDEKVKTMGRGHELKLVAHYPKVFFLADESDYHSRALVLRGLAVVNASHVVKVEAVGTRNLDSQSVDSQHITSVDAQLHGLETYINPDVNVALRFSKRHAEMIGQDLISEFLVADDSEETSVSDLLGVALIQPVTTGIEYIQMERDLFPTRRSFVVNIEPVSTMLSFEDLQLVEVVLNRWSSRESARGGRLPNSPVSFSEGLITSYRSKERYEIEFREARLGLGLKTDDDKVVVSSFQNDEYSDQIHQGDRLVSIDGDLLLDKKLNEVVRMLSEAKRPVSIVFERPIFMEPNKLSDERSFLLGGAQEVTSPTANLDSATKHEEFSCLVYSVQFHLGMSMGLDLEESACGKFPVVTKILPIIDEAVVVSHSVDTSDAEQIEVVEPAFDPETTRIPKVGAVVVAIDDVPIEEIGVEEAWSLLSQTQRPIGGGSRGSGATFHLTFQEIPSELWGRIDTADVSVAGISLSFIDDLNGRDMPLFRGKLSTLEFHAERGVGVEAHIIDSTVPSLLSPLEAVSLDDSIAMLTSDEVLDLRSESILSLSAIGRFSLEYFHPKVSYWEPLLEPCQMFFLLEKQEGSITSSRPAQVALEMSDRLPRNHFVRTNLAQSIYFNESSMIPVNVTDAAVDVLFQTLGQWKKWRKDLAATDPNQYSPIPDSLSASDGLESIVEKSKSWTEPAVSHTTELETAAAQKAAQAALNFAKKRGAETSTSRDTSKPFILRNRTGIGIAFVQQGKGVRDQGYPRRLMVDGRNGVDTAIGEYKGLEGYEQDAITELADQEDAKFDMDVIDNDLSNETSTRRSARFLSNKVRNYEGRYPNLTIAAQAVAGVTVEPLKDLQVFKVGSTCCDLIVRKESLDSSSGIHTIQVIWNVEIEDNRRILTISSAVRLVSSVLAIPIEIGVRERQLNLTSLSRALQAVSPTTSIGFASSQEPYYMPLWLSLKLEPVEICVRPASSAGGFKWSEQEILQFVPASEELTATTQKWAWKQRSQDLDFVQCGPVHPGRQHAFCFSVFRSTPSVGDNSLPTGLHMGRSMKSTERNDDSAEVGLLSITLDSCLTLRNLLPTGIAWEVSRDATAVPVATSHILSTSTAFEDHCFSRTDSLHSGECTEVPECSNVLSNVRLRFKQIGGESWSNSAALKLKDANDAYDELDLNDPADGLESFLPSSEQVNVQIPDDSFGTPLTLGVRMVPKTTSDDPVLGQCYGLDVVVYAELWIRNITSLPLHFGCPTQQLHHSTNTMPAASSSFDESVAKFTAESALMEIANLLEVGDKGTGLNQATAREIAERGSIESIPNQMAPILVEEVFEYVEIDGSTIRRRWWASESFDSFRHNITQVQDLSGDWKWLDENWAIDISGEAKPSVDGWESCRNLLAGDGSFTGNRTFNPSHGFRRRRYFRTRSGIGYSGRTIGRISHQFIGNSMPDEIKTSAVAIQAFHQPLNDSFSREKRRLRWKGNNMDKTGSTRDVPIKLAIKCGDGKWSSPIIIPDTGTSFGVIKVLASRWPHLAKDCASKQASNVVVKRREFSAGELPQNIIFKTGSLASDLFELCYAVSDVEGEWGEFSRTVEFSPRFVLRNDSTSICLLVKQSGTSESSSLKLMPGEASPFYWSDFHLPRLVSVKPYDPSTPASASYKWSGGFDLCSLGMTPIRIRREDGQRVSAMINSIRSLVEVRPGTGGMGINVSLREENPEGEGTLFRIENLTPFPIWLEQDGMLANPATRPQHPEPRIKIEHFEPPIDGDLIAPHTKSTFALDVPYRQGKYVNRQEASLIELLHVRVGLAPLSSRFGIEMVKVIGLTEVGETIRMNPSRLPLTLSQQQLESLRPIRVLGVVASDGPTRVLKFCLMSYSGTDDVFSRNLGEISYSMQPSNGKEDQIFSSDRTNVTPLVSKGAQAAIDLSRSETIPNEIDAKRRALFSNFSGSGTKEGSVTSDGMDTIFSVRAEFSGFILSLVDSAPSEIAVVSCRNVNALTRWNKLRTADASVLLSVGWLQVDNHVPNAPFKVAVRPDTSIKQRVEKQSSNEDGTGPSPLLVVALAFAPKHKSKIMVLRSVTVAPRDLVIALDLAFLVRVQRFLVGLQDHAQRSRGRSSIVGKSGTNNFADEKLQIQLPVFASPEKQLEMIASFSENQKLYFQGLTILPTNIKLSVAPARALTPEQASLEGKETAAIHEAVRKGDVLVGSSGGGPLGVRVGKRNKTPIAVVRGIFKSIIVDALLRLDGASLNFPGVFLRNHIATGSQLTTLLLAHYVSSLKSNVPALLGSLAAIGNPVGLIRGIGDGVSDFVTEPVKGFKRSLKELDPGYVVDGVARGTESLARHTVGGLADSASLLMETFAKYMAVVTLDRRYAQKRDRRRSLRNRNETRVTLAGGVESGFSKLIQGFREGVTGVVRAPIRGAEKRGLEGFAKGLGKGLLGLLMKPIIGITDAAADVMIGVKSTVEYKEEQQQNLALLKNQLRPRRPMYGRDKVLRPYRLEDAAAATLMLRTRCAGENYLSHLDMNDRVALLSVRRLIILGPQGEEQLALKYKHVEKLEVRSIKQEDGSDGWGIVVILNTPRRNGSDVEVISCHTEQEATTLCYHIQRGVDLEMADGIVPT